MNQSFKFLPNNYFEEGDLLLMLLALIGFQVKSWRNLTHNLSLPEKLLFDLVFHNQHLKIETSAEKYPKELQVLASLSHSPLSSKSTTCDNLRPGLKIRKPLE